VVEYPAFNRSIRVRFPAALPIRIIMSETIPPIFYCPYDLAIQTMNAIWESKKKEIEILRSDGYSDDDIDDMISL
jgi:hypothetical protein